MAAPRSPKAKAVIKNVASGKAKMNSFPDLIDNKPAPKKLPSVKARSQAHKAAAMKATPKSK
jgi:hypothetical protein